MATQTILIGDGHTTPDYDDLYDFETSEPYAKNWGGDDVVLEISGDAEHGANTPDLSGATNINSLTIRPASGEECLGETGRSGAARVIGGSGNIELGDDCDIAIEDLEFDQNSGSTANGMMTEASSTSPTITIDRCVFHNHGSGSWHNRGIESTGASTWTVRNTIFHDMYGSGMGTTNSANRTIITHGVAFYDCNQSNDADSGGIDYYQLVIGSTTECKNCMALGNTRYDFRHNPGTAEANMSSDGTATGTNSHANETTADIWTDPANADFTLKASTNAVDGGATISALSPDAAGTTRPQGSAYDMGPLEFVSGGGGGGVAVLRRRREGY